jgi:hypothetical protein
MSFSVITSDNNQYTYNAYVDRGQAKEERKNMSKDLHQYIGSKLYHYDFSTGMCSYWGTSGL